MENFDLTFENQNKLMNDTISADGARTCLEAGNCKTKADVSFEIAIPPYKLSVRHQTHMSLNSFQAHSAVQSQWYHN